MLDTQVPDWPTHQIMWNEEKGWVVTNEAGPWYCYNASLEFDHIKLFQAHKDSLQCTIKHPRAKEIEKENREFEWPKRWDKTVEYDKEGKQLSSGYWFIHHMINHHRSILQDGGHALDIKLPQQVENLPSYDLVHRFRSIKNYPNRSSGKPKDKSQSSSLKGSSSRNNVELPQRKKPSTVPSSRTFGLKIYGYRKEIKQHPVDCLHTTPPKDGSVAKKQAFF
ncbi:hypothetical protein T439DRAFT_331437 [Meredithblackwellia eburnea MCA 4105]